MSDPALVIEQLEQAAEALERIPGRVSGISEAAGFFESPEGREKLDGLCMVLIAVGEAIKKIDRRTDGRLLARHPAVDWKGVMGVRDVIAHDYFDLDAEQVLAICRNDVPPLIRTLRAIIDELRGGWA